MPSVSDCRRIRRLPVADVNLAGDGGGDKGGAVIAEIVDLPGNHGFLI